MDMFWWFLWRHEHHLTLLLVIATTSLHRQASTYLRFVLVRKYLIPPLVRLLLTAGSLLWGAVVRCALCAVFSRWLWPRSASLLVQALFSLILRLAIPEWKSFYCYDTTMYKSYIQYQQHPKQSHITVSVHHFLSFILPMVLGSLIIWTSVYKKVYKIKYPSYSQVKDNFT